MVIDCHYHLESPFVSDSDDGKEWGRTSQPAASTGSGACPGGHAVEQRAFDAEALLQEMDRSGVNRVAIMGSIIELFPEPPKFLLRILQVILESRRLRRLGQALVANFTPRGEIKILGRPYQIVTEPDNGAVFDAVHRHPGRFLGWVFVNPRGRLDPLEELRKYRDEPGFIFASCRPRMTPMWDRPRADPLPRARPILGGLIMGYPLSNLRVFGIRKKKTDFRMKR